MTTVIVSGLAGGLGAVVPNLSRDEAARFVARQAERGRMIEVRYDGSDGSCPNEAFHFLAKHQEANDE